MNVARSTFVRRGYLLTALAVAVLLAASSGTAWAQTTPTVYVGASIRTSSSTLQENADVNPDTPPPVTVTITRTGPDTYDPTPGDATNTADNETPIFTTGTHFNVSSRI